MRLTLLPIPDELIRLVATKQLGEVFNLFTAIPNRALSKQGWLPMRFLRHPKLCLCRCNIGLRDDLDAQPVKDVRIASAVAVHAALASIGLFEVNRNVGDPSKASMGVDNCVGAVGGGDFSEFPECHGQRLPSLCGIFAVVWYEYSIAAVAQRQVYTAISQCVIPALLQRPTVAMTREMTEMTISRQSEKAGRPKTPQDSSLTPSPPPGYRQEK